MTDPTISYIDVFGEKTTSIFVESGRSVDGGLNPRINGAGQNIGTEFAVIPPEQKDWTVSPLSTPLAARGGGRRPAFTGD